jgi:hypothetical protein
MVIVNVSPMSNLSGAECSMVSKGRVQIDREVAEAAKVT